MKTSRRWIISAEISSYLLYAIYLISYMGRRFMEGYYSSLGIPTSLVHYSPEDTFYYGIFPPMFFMFLAFMLLALGVLRFINLPSKQTPSFRREKIPFFKKIWRFIKSRRKTETAFAVFLFIYFCVSYIPLLFFDFSNPMAEAFITLMMLLMTAGAGVWLIWYTGDVIIFLKEHRKISIVCIVRMLKKSRICS